MVMVPGTTLGPYEILSAIGEGGMGRVYRARDTRLGRDVAIKVSHEAFSDRFEREARAAAALNHPNIAQLYDIGSNYLVMELVDGTPIAPTDDMRRLLDLAIQIADGLAAAHAAGLLHRDLKPDNILVTGPASTHPHRVKILDFGLAKSAIASDGDVTRMTRHTDPGTIVGTVSYMSPEQARGDAHLTIQSDQFSLGLILYELATGKRPFQRSSAAETMTAIIRDDAEALPASVPCRSVGSSSGCSRKIPPIATTRRATSIASSGRSEAGCRRPRRHLRQRRRARAVGCRRARSRSRQASLRSGRSRHSWRFGSPCNVRHRRAPTLPH